MSIYPKLKHDDISNYVNQIIHVQRHVYISLKICMYMFLFHVYIYIYIYIHISIYVYICIYDSSTS